MSFSAACMAREVALALKVALLALVLASTSLFGKHAQGFAGIAVGRAARPRIVRHAVAASGEEVMVVGLMSQGWATAKIVASLSQSLGYISRPVISNAVNEEEAFGTSGVKGYVFGGPEPLPKCTALVLADEFPSQPDKLVACVRGLAAVGSLKRVALLSRPYLQGSSETEAKVIEACSTVGVEWAVVQVGKLRGGGPATGAPHCVGKELYDLISANGLAAAVEEEIFDLQKRGFRVADASAGFSFGNSAFFVPETSRMVAAAALASSLSSPAAAGKKLSLVSDVSKHWPDEAVFESAWRDAA
eukprot:TRINITY_DN15489_c0_g2_i1.p1 TRINITY_DN15489_c0_g2~~TRINITY_DN15489_c0_g2_i1.p1  ORF type:complete len:303 (+),score=49.59 TRINITY_DN15489_c0_g2_i1:91-999(+)